MICVSIESNRVIGIVVQSTNTIIAK